MRCLVTGAAGFIGSHLCEQLLHAGHEVTGLDCFIAYYPRSAKEANLSEFARHPRFRFYAADLRTDPLDTFLEEADVVFHLAAMPGLVQSWTSFDTYTTCNVQATQRLLEAVQRTGKRLQRFILASTSSVYGRFASGDESLPTRPVSPYGVTKLAAEHLCRAYAEATDLPLVILRYFSVYGPRQRPDMAYHRFMRALLNGEPITVYGDGEQVRGNTFIQDCVAATVAAVRCHVGETYNIGGGETATVWDIIRRLERLTGLKARIQQEAARTGDQRHTFADCAKLLNHVGWEPRNTLDEGLEQQWEWIRRRHGFLQGVRAVA
jgi:nucleoside-diphosphate-sugar epimerase